MRRALLASCLGAICFSAAVSAEAAIITVDLPAGGLITLPNSYGGNSSGTGVWFNMLTGSYFSNGYNFPTPLFSNGQFFLLEDTEYVQTEAEIFTQGYFSNGNGVIYGSSSKADPARFSAGANIGPSSGYQSPGAGYSDLGPTYGYWAAGGHGFIGLEIPNPSGSGTDYGYAEININSDFSTTLLSFAYNTVPGQAIVAVSAPVPEPASLGVLGLAGALGLRRRRRV